MRFVVVAPKNYRGGAIVLHELCRELCRQGHDARIFYYFDCIYKKNDKLNFWRNWVNFTWKDVINDIKKQKTRKKTKTDSLGGCRRKIIPSVSNDTIVIYPEVVYGNILNSRKTVRWLLSNNRYGNDPDAYGINDLFVCYRLQFNDQTLNPHNNRLAVGYYNFDLYKQTNFGERKGKCYLIHKGSMRSDLPLSFDGIVVDGLTETEKVKVFNECEYCISYDLQTGYTSIATLCGCMVIMAMEEGKTRKDYKKEDDPRMYGVAFGFDKEEIAYARETLPHAKDQIIENINEKNKTVKSFIELCNNYYFGE